MAYREVNVFEVKEVLLLWLKGISKSEIGRRVGVDRKTARTYIHLASSFGLTEDAGEAALTDALLTQVLVALKSPASRPHGPAWGLCVAHQSFIASKLAEGLLLTKVRRLLERDRVLIPYPTLHRFAVEVLSFGKGTSTIPVADCEPGQELQLDTGWMTLLHPDEQGVRRRFRAWIFTAVRSRHRFVFPCFRETTQTAIEACEAAWAFFGGVFHVLIPDNTKTIVQTADPLQAQLNATFLEYAQARGFHIDPTRSRSPQDKGRVERTVRTTRDDCFAGEDLHDLPQAQVRANIWSKDEYGMRRHSRTQRRPLEHFLAEEQPALLPAPSQAYDVPQHTSPTVRRDQHVEVAKALYSLPRHLIGHCLLARADRSTVRLYQHQVLLKTHPRQPAGGRSTDPADFAPEQLAYAMRDSAFLQRRATACGAAVGAFAQEVLAGPLPWTRMRQVYALLGLCKRYGDARVEAACTLALAAEMHEFYRLKRMVEQASPASPPSEPGRARVIPLARYLRPASTYALPPPAAVEPTPTPEEEKPCPPK